MIAIVGSLVFNFVRDAASPDSHSYSQTWVGLESENTRNEYFLHSMVDVVIALSEVDIGTSAVKSKSNEVPES